MKSYSTREVIKILRRNDWKLDRINGDHYIFRKLGRKYVTVVPISRETLKVGTLKNIEKQSGIKFK